MSKHKPQVYLAGPFADKLLFRERRDVLTGLGFNVVARWVDEDQFTSDTVPSQTGEAPSSEYLAEWAVKDYEDAAACEVFITLPGKGAGHHSELGIALHNGATIIVAGDKNNVFHYLPDVIHLPNWDALIEYLLETYPDGYFATE